MNITNYIGNTPLVKLKTRDKYADIYVKLEYFNAGGSIKSRISKAMIEDAESKGILKSGMTIIEPTGGNTGIGLAIVSQLKSYRFIAVVPDNYSEERINLLRYYGAEVILSDNTEGNDSHIKKANSIIHENPQLIHLDQFNNKACIDAHYEGTGKEIISRINVDVFVSSVGSSGTFTGISRRLKRYNKHCKCYICQPKGCNILTGEAIKHKFQGISLGIIPPLLDQSLIDGVINIEFEEVKSLLKDLALEQGLFLGISSGANILSSYKLAEKIGAGKTICTVAPDGGQYYIPDIYR